MQTDEITNYYEDNYKGYSHLVDEFDVWWPFIWKPIKQYTNNNNITPGTVKILDVACGDGRYSYELKKRGYEQTYAVDLYEKIDLDLGGYYKKASMDNLPFEDGEFDVIFCFSALFHLDDIGSGIKEFTRCLKPGGYLIITAHTKYSLFTLKDKIKLKLNLKSVTNLKGVHFDRDSSEYLNEFSKNGLVTVRQDGMDVSLFYVFIYEVYAHAFNNKFGTKFPIIRRRYSKNKTWGRIKSHIGYHSVLWAKKFRG